MMGFETQGKHKYINKRKKKLIFSTIYVDGGTRDTTLLVKDQCTETIFKLSPDRFS